MKVLHLTHTHIPSDNRILKEITALTEISGAQLYGIGIYDGEAGQNTKLESEATIESLDLISRRWTVLPGPLRHLLIALELSGRLLYRGLKLRPRIVHCHDTPVLLVGVLLKRILGAKLVYDAHELESDKNGQSRWISWLTFKLERLSWSSIDLLISVSPSIISWYQDRLGLKPHALVLNSPLIASTANYNSPTDSTHSRYFHRKYDIPADARVFLYLGLLVSGRGIEKALEAFSADSVASHVVFIGYGPLVPEIRRAASITGRIHLHEPVPHEQVVSFSRSADLGLCLIENVSLSDYYSLPNKLFEYAFAGIPVLASAFPDITELVEKYRLGECCAIDMQSIINAIRRIENNPTITLGHDLQAISWKAQGSRLRCAYQMLNS